MKNACAKRRKLLVVIVKYANVVVLVSLAVLVYLSSSNSFPHGPPLRFESPSANCKASQITLNIPTNFAIRGKLCHIQPKLRALSCSQLSHLSPCSFPNAFSSFLSSFSFILKKAKNSRNNHPCESFAHDGGICQNSLFLIMEDSRSESLIFLGVSLCGLVSMYSVSLYGRTERSVKVLVRVMKKNISPCMDRGCYTLVIHALAKRAKLLVSTLNMEICDVLGNPCRHGCLSSLRSFPHGTLCRFESFLLEITTKNKSSSLE